jgi:integrase
LATVRRISPPRTATPARARIQSSDRQEHHENRSPRKGKNPTAPSGVHAKDYITWLRTVGDAKRPATINTEQCALNKFAATYPEVRVNAITPALLLDYQAKRKTAGVSGRTVNLDSVAVRSVLRRAKDQGFLQTVPTVKPLKHTTATHRLLSAGEIERIAEAALKVCKYGRMVADFVLLMAYSGGRWGETLRLKWADVDFAGRQLHFGRDGLSKSGKPRAVDFNDRLEAQLRDMHGRRPPDSEFLFRSPRAEGDAPLKTLNMGIRKARVAAGVPDFHPHLARHFFASFCVMSGVDILTVARWLGHADGGVLIAKTYGHLAAEHTQAAARKVVFTPQVVATAAATA